MTTCLFGAFSGAVFCTPVLAANTGIEASNTLFQASLRPLAGKKGIKQEKESPSAMQHMLAGWENNQQHQQQTKAGKRRTGNTRQGRISTYSLYGDPVFKLAGVGTDKRYFGTEAGPHGIGRFGSGLGTGLGSSMPANAQPSAKAASAGELDGEGIGFGCGEKEAAKAPVTSRTPFHLDMSACYKLRFARSWQTQTYVSKGFGEGNTGWGGGLSFSYAH